MRDDVELVSQAQLSERAELGRSFEVNQGITFYVVSEDGRFTARVGLPRPEIRTSAQRYPVLVRLVGPEGQYLQRRLVERDDAV
ncbi:MAG: hypothetical protein ACNS63_01965, partial [Candidatus Nitrospinota bacterium M3_3B_026]